MPKVNVYNQLGEVVGDIELNEAIFGIEVNEHVVYEVVKNHLAIEDKAHNLQKLVQKFVVVEENLGDKKVPVVQDKVA